MAFLSWIGKTIVNAILGRLLKYLGDLMKDRADRKADHEENAREAKEDTAKLREITRDEADGEKVDRAIDDAFKRF